MRNAAFLATMLLLLPVAAVQPFAGVLLWSWISFMNPHRLLYGTAAGLPWAVIVFCATLVGCVLAQQPRRPALNAVTVLIVVLMACFTITSLAALAPPEAVWAKWDRIEKVLLGLLLTASLLTDRRRIHALVWVMVISLGFYGVKGGLFSLLTGGNYRVWGPDETMITDNNHLAAAMLISLPLMNYLRLHSRHQAVRLGLAAAMGLTLLATVGSYSRGALLGLAAVSAILWLRSRRKVAGGIVLAASLAGAIAFMPAGWTERMNTIGAYQADESASERLVLWGISFKLAAARPLVGSGFAGPYTQDVVDRVAPGGPARAVHSIWFELLGEHGFPTFAAWAGLSIAGLLYCSRVIRLARRHPHLGWAGDLGRMGQISIVAYLVSGSFLSLSYWDYYWTLLVVVGAAHGVAVRAARSQDVAAAPAQRMWRRARARSEAPAWASAS